MAPRRFSVERHRQGTTLQFGHGTDVEIKNPSVADPSKVILDIYGRDYITDPSFDPARLNSTDKFGIAPSDTTLYITYRTNTAENMNASVGAITGINNPRFEFSNPASLDSSLLGSIIASVEVANEEPLVGDMSLPSIDELKTQIKSYFASQKRAVTKQDYMSLTYAMPPKFGSIKRCNIVQDINSFKRNLNMYVLAESPDGTLATATSTIKENLITWLNTGKMVNDTIDILDANIVNFGINFAIIGDTEINATELLVNCQTQLQQLYADSFNIGEPLDVAQIYKTLNRIAGVVDTTDVQIIQKTGINYSDIYLNVEKNISPDGRMILIPFDTILELKFPGSDITGQIVGNIPAGGAAATSGAQSEGY